MYFWIVSCSHLLLVSHHSTPHHPQPLTHRTTPPTHRHPAHSNGQRRLGGRLWLPSHVLRHRQYGQQRRIVPRHRYVYQSMPTVTLFVVLFSFLYSLILPTHPSTPPPTPTPPNSSTHPLNSFTHPPTQFPPLGSSLSYQSGSVSVTTGRAGSGNSGAISIGTGTASSGRAGSIYMTVGSGNRYA